MSYNRLTVVRVRYGLRSEHARPQYNRKASMRADPFFANDAKKGGRSEGSPLPSLYSRFWSQAGFSPYTRIRFKKIM